MQPMPIDESLAFTALLELDPHYRKLSSAACAVRREALLRDWHAQETVRNMWDFTRRWLAAEERQLAFLNPARTMDPKGENP